MLGRGLGHFAHNYALYFLITWLPLYLVKSRGFSLPQMSELGALLYILYATSTQASGLIADRWMRAGASSTCVRKTIVTIGHLGVATCMAVCALGGATASVVGLVASGLFLGMNTATIFPIGQILGGPHAAGKWMGVQNCLANLAGILAPIVTGYVVDATGKFGIAFALAAGMSLVGIVGWAVIVRRVETVDWA